MATIRNKMDGNVRTLKAHPANNAAASELKQHLEDIDAQYWRSSYLMEIYISVLEEEARQDEREPDLRAVGERDEGMRREYEQACIIACQSLARTRKRKRTLSQLHVHACRPELASTET